MAMAADSHSYPISSNSRAKLNAFRYAEDEAIPNHVVGKDDKQSILVNKENQISWLNGVVDPVQKTSDNRSDLAPSLEHEKEANRDKECPQTPGNRIPLADLISNAEDSFDPTPGPEVTPVDHVVWQHIPASSNPDASSQTSAGRQRKRRHSSSSAGSPSKSDSKKSQTEPLDLQSIHALLKTPQHDLATELWNNYMDKNMMDATEKVPPPRLSNLLSSSPQTPGSGRTSRDSSGLRRSISCAAEWPTSRAKRRRLTRQNPGSGRGIFTRTNSNVLDSGNTKSSRINFLLDKIERSLQPASAADMGPPNSSPLRKRIDAERCRSSSPIADRKGPGLGEGTKQILDTFSRTNPAKTGTEVLDDSSSEFADDDLDQGLIDLVDASEDPFVAPATNRAEFETLGSSAWSKFASERVALGQVTKPPIVDNKSPIVPDFTNSETQSVNQDDLDDEYGDFSENFEEILAKCGSKSETKDLFQSTIPLQQHGRKSGPVAVRSGLDISDEPQKKSVQDVDIVSSEDEFDDDFDLDVIEQTMKEAGKDEAYVCRS